MVDAVVATVGETEVGDSEIFDGILHLVLKGWYNTDN